MSDEVVRALRSNKSITLRVGAGAMSGGAARAGSEGQQPRAGSLPARVLGWAQRRKKPFHTHDVEKKFRLSRAHASMLLSRLANGPYDIERSSRGVYEYTGSR